MKQVKILWNRFAKIPVEFANIPMDMDFSQALKREDYAALIAKAKAAPHPAFELSPEVFVELPPEDWKHGDFLVYLPKHGWLVRRNYSDYWYIDIGLFKKIDEDIYGWTDLWLDVVAPESASSYHVLDAEEFGEAIREGRVSTELTAYALEKFDHLVRTIHDGNFPLPEVQGAENFAME